MLGLANLWSEWTFSQEHFLTVLGRNQANQAYDLPEEFKLCKIARGKRIEFLGELATLHWPEQRVLGYLAGLMEPTAGARTADLIASKDEATEDGGIVELRSEFCSGEDDVG